MSKIKYTDIGHSHPNDVLWLWIDDNPDNTGIRSFPAGQCRTHELIWGGETTVTKHWRGRVESTGRCSIAPPEGVHGGVPWRILKELIQDFNATEFYHFANDGRTYRGWVDVMFEPIENFKIPPQKFDTSESIGYSVDGPKAWASVPNLGRIQCLKPNT